jgi:F-type H+-transporting ATPase subunit delta
MSLAVAKQYAQALADLVFAPGSAIGAEEVAGQLRAVEEIAGASPELRTILLSPAVPPARKRAVLARLTASIGLAPLVRNFLFVVIDRRRTPLLGQIREAFEALVDERRGVVRAHVRSASEPAERHKSRLADALAAMTGKQVRCEYVVEEELLGGILLRLGSTVWDGSLRGRLEALRQRLAG